MLSFYQRLSFFGVLLALGVVMLGAFTRLSDAGLGCPDWPGCYGQLVAPSNEADIATANAAYPQAPVETAKAHIEMSHRYFAFSLACIIAFLGFSILFKRRQFKIPAKLPLILMTLVIGQALLGMWTVTLKLLPLIVLLHLVGGLATLSLLWLMWLYLKYPNVPALKKINGLQTLALASLMLLILQIMLGGWTSANYAALICPDFPMCQQQWWPAMSLKALNLFGGIGIEHPLAYMDSAEKTSIHMLHRLFALITLVVVGFFSLRLFKSPNAVLKKLAVLLGALLALQVSLGIANVVMSLPLHNAVAHHGTAAILLLTLIAINYVLLRGKRDRG